MYGLGWDCARWNVLCTVTAAMILVILTRGAHPGHQKLTRGERDVCILLLAFNMVTASGLFGSQQVNAFPFYEVFRGN